MNRVELILKDITDIYVRENFKRLSEFFRADSFRIPDWKFFEITFSAGGSMLSYPHRLGYLPKDILITNITDSENVIPKYEEFTKEFFYFDVSGACTVRFFAGTYRE